MSTRNLTMVVDRKHAEQSELGFAAPPSTYADKSYVNMYLHHDGYPEWQGVQLANWCHTNARQDGSALAAKLVLPVALSKSAVSSSGVTRDSVTKKPIR